MNSSRYGVGNRSGASQSQNQLKPAKGLWGKLIRFFQTGWLNPRSLYRQARRLLWVGTTGLIFLIAPFAFSHFLEVSEELSQISRMGAQEMSKI
ncbi:unnamed protein product [Paramecium octaurelia]|uniref:Uncharacterized protein n=1 Tax=Paramecium octaurelia TaxID=43137 RepID=A0A8S1TX05_PAROT|nr:unnamed protein product [Paramecium octaurelia]